MNPSGRFALRAERPHDPDQAAHRPDYRGVRDRDRGWVGRDAVGSTGLRQGNVLGLTWGQVHLDRRMAMIEHGDTKNGAALGVPLNDIAMAVLLRQQGKHEKSVFTY